jgi:hypothetical protein
VSRPLRAVGRGARAVGAFLWDFVVGDDWSAAIGVVAVLALARLTRAWWLLPPAVIGVLALTLVRPRRAATRSGRPVEGGPSPR